MIDASIAHQFIAGGVFSGLSDRVCCFFLKGVSQALVGTEASF